MYRWRFLSTNRPESASIVCWRLWRPIGFGSATAPPLLSILPGIATSARALAEQTDALPQVTIEFLDKPPAALGKSTVTAIESGIYWGAIGAIRELVSQLSAPFPIRPDLFITGGASRQVVDLLKTHGAVRHVPNLVLSGIALVKV